MNKKQQREEILFRTRNAVRILLFGEYQEKRLLGTKGFIELPNDLEYSQMASARWLCESLYRIERTLHRWYELECGTDQGCIEQDEKSGKWELVQEFNGKHFRRPVANREAGAKRRLAKLIKPYAETCAAYFQTDPRGAALYLYNPRKFAMREIENNSANAICICNRF